MTVWSRQRTQMKTGSQYFSKTFHISSWLSHTLIYHLWVDKALGPGPPNPMPVFQKRKAAAQKSEAVGDSRAGRLWDSDSKACFLNSWKNKPTKHLPVLCRLPLCAELQGAIQCHLPHRSSVQWSWFYPQLGADRQEKDGETMTGHTWGCLPRTESPKGPEDVSIDTTDMQIFEVYWHRNIFF